MIPGIGGHLIPVDFLESVLEAEPASIEAEHHRRTLARWRATVMHLGPASSLTAMADEGAERLAAVLGFDPPVERRGTTDSIALRLTGTESSVLFHTTAWGVPLQGHWRQAVVAALHAGATWCLLFNGTHLRLVRTSRLYSRRHVEFELDTAADVATTARALWRLCSAGALDHRPGTGLDALLARADTHAAGVCRSLRGGVLDATEHVLRALVLGRARSSAAAAFEQSLTIVYRLLFLLFAEARALVPLWHPVYRESYSIEMLRERSLARRHRGLWDALRAMTRLAHAGCTVGSLRVTPFNGRLFAPQRTPLAERRGLDDEAARQAVLAVSTRPSTDRSGRQPVSYRDLGVEELGAVYETLLDYQPHVQGRSRSVEVSLQPGSGVRKSTGTFYTPRAIAAYLIREALAPLVIGAAPEEILALKVLDPAMGSGAFLVGACRFLADAYEAALIERGGCLPSDLGPADRAAIRRTIAERCLFGVDLNPTAVQLARLSLWLTTLAADRPLTFLDHHLRVGDSLSGTWVHLLSRSPKALRTGRELPLLDGLPLEDTMRGVLPARLVLATAPNDTVAQVQAKERLLATLAGPESGITRWRRVAHTWCAAWLADPPVPPAAFAALRDSLLRDVRSLPPATTRALLAQADEAGAGKRLFHWELEFPEVFFDGEGRRRANAGFDAVLGNPPWDMVRADADGDRARQRRDATATLRFARESGVYEARSAGHANRYQLFVERAVALARPGGRIGLVLPSGVLSDHGSAPVRRLLLHRTALERIVGFENRAGLFPIHRSVKFVLLSATAGARTDEVLCRFGETDPAVLEDTARLDGRLAAGSFPVRLTPRLLERLSGDDLSFPEVRGPRDLAIAERAAALFPPLGAVEGWQARFGRELNATDDRDCLRTDGEGWPVLEGKLLDPFRTRPHEARWHVRPQDAAQRTGPRTLRTRLAYRDVASATNRVTLIAAMLPPRTASTHTVFSLKTTLPLAAQHFLCAVLNSLTVNYLARQRVSSHVTTAIVERLPVPTRDRAGAAFDPLAHAAERLSQAYDLDAVVQLNALVAHLYELTRDEFAHVLGTFPLVPHAERAAMLGAFERT